MKNSASFFIFWKKGEDINMSGRIAGNAMRNHQSELAYCIGKKAWQALLEEVYTTPKPGLVDLYSCGAHTDMDVSTFEKSARALYPYFVKMAASGYGMQIAPDELFREIRKTGIEAEKAMYQATDGVNTHKGLLFTIGIFCAAAGRCVRECGKITERNLFEMEQEMVTEILAKEVRNIEEKDPETHGEKNFKRYGTSGIRGEALKGYPAVRYIALPILRQGIMEKREWNLVKLQTLFYLMREVEDSNIISRQNPETLKQVHREADGFLKCGGAYAADAIEKLKQMDAEYIRRNISAGGCADLLAAAIFVESLLR